MDDDLCSTILEALPSSPDEGIGFNELLRRLEEKAVTNSPTTLSKYLKELQAKQIVKREVIRANPPKLVKLFKDPEKVQEDVLKKQLVGDFQECINPLPLDSLTLVANAFREMADRQAKVLQMLHQRIEEATAPLAEIFAALNEASEVASRPFREIQEWVEENSKRIKQLADLVQEIEEGVKAGKLDPSIRKLPISVAIRKLQELKEKERSKERENVVQK